MTNPVFFFDYSYVAGESFRLDGDEGRHGATVKRIRVGETIDVMNGRGLRASCNVTEVGRDWLDLEVININQEAQSQPRMIVVQALAKGDRADLALEILTEVGVDVIVPWSATHSIVKWDDPKKAHSKWHRTIVEATKQSRRSWIPELTDLHTTTQVCDLLGTVDVALVLHESATDPLVAVDVTNAQTIALVVGPEGGISSDELAQFVQAGAAIVRMGSSVMRTSTAGGIAAGALFSRTNRWS
jgi:16S rRNA (uracil1498-N3)-methyltransferase